MFIAKKFDICESLLKNFDIFITIVFMAAGIFFRHQAELVLRHQMQVSNYLVKFFYSMGEVCFGWGFLTVYLWESIRNT